MPPFRIRVSTRARHVHLRVSARTGLEVVIPPGFDRALIPVLLARKQRWITRALRGIGPLPTPHADPPNQIHFRALDHIWPVSYLHRDTAALRTTLQHNSLVVAGPVADTDACLRTLRRWTARQARIHLLPRLEELSQMHGLPFSKIRIANQRTRWGSCSHRHTISLNLRLLFLPPALVRYVLLHELCHTVHLDHSPRFWARLAHLEPDSATLHHALQHANTLVPDWVYPS